jgi:hypothetical protein
MQHATQQIKLWGHQITLRGNNMISYNPYVSVRNPTVKDLLIQVSRDA